MTAIPDTDSRLAWRLVGGLCLLQATLLSVVPWATHLSLPLDVVREGLAWGREWQWGYHKHPPLPSWIVELSFRMLGDYGPFLAAQLAVCATYLFVFLLGRAMLGPLRAAVGTLLLVGVFYFLWPTPEFNHNLAQMPVWAAVLYCFHRALMTGALGWWAALGLCAGVGLLTKYAAIVLLLLVVAYPLLARETRSIYRSAGPYVAVALASLVVVPHLAWLVAHDFLPFAYAEARGGVAPDLWWRIGNPANFLLAQAIDHLPMVVLLAVGGLIPLSRARAAVPGAPAVAAAPAPADRRFLLVFGLGPAALAVALSLAAGIGIRQMWGAPMWNLSGLLAVMWLARSWPRLRLGRLAAATFALVALVAAAYGGRVLYGDRIEGRPGRATWPDREMAARLEALWRERTGCPLGIVAGETWLAGLIAMRARSRPSVFLHGDARIAPWITPGRLAAEGALAVWRAEEGRGPPRSLARLPGFSLGGIDLFAWPRLPEAPPLAVGWGIVPPRAPCAPDRDDTPR